MDFTGERYVPAIEGQIKYEHLHRYALCLELVAGKTVLDIASGEGYGTALLASVAKSVTGVDIDAPSVEHAKHFYCRTNLTFLLGSCDRMPLPDRSFDVVTSFETIEHHDKHEEMLDEVKRVLKPGGTLIISSPNRLTYSDEPGYRNPFHVKELYYDEFYELLRRRFTSIRMFGQRLAAGSFVFPLGASAGSGLKSLTGEAGAVNEHVRELSSPIYFVAICSDDAAIAERDLSSVYLDRVDDLWRTIERERLHDIGQMQGQVQRTEEEIGRQRASYEAEIARLNEELLSVRTAYEGELADMRASHMQQLLERDAMIVHRDETIIERDDAIAQLRAHWAVSEKNIREHVEHIRAYERLLSEAQAQIARHIEVLNWIYASRFWRIGNNTLKRLEHVNERLSRHGELFRGELEAPPSPVSDSLTVRGWVYSTAAPVTLVEAFLDDFYLGGLRYGEERPGLAGAPLKCGFAGRISLHGFNFGGDRTVKVRVHDQKGNRQVFTRPVTVVAGGQTKIEVPTEAEAFRGEMEYAEAGSSGSECIEVAGWVYSKAAPVVFIEAYLGESYLGRVSYGIERPDVVAAYPMEAPLRCGYSKVFTLNGLTRAAEQTLKLRFYDSQGNTQVSAGSVSEARARQREAGIGEARARQREAGINNRPQSVAAEIAGEHRPPLQWEQAIGNFQEQFGRDPSILDWDSRVDLRSAFPNLAVFSPPTPDDTLPYLDHTVDVVVTSSSDPAHNAEARRVSRAAVIRVLDSGLLDVDWQLTPGEKPLETVSIIIPVFNEVNYTRSCLDELLKTLPHNFRGEILIIDDASSDNTPQVLETYASADNRIKLLRNLENAGFIESCNHAAEKASGEILVFLNNDTLPKPGWLPPLLRVLREKPDAGAVGGKLIYPDGTLQEAGGVIFSDGSGCNFGKYDKAANAPLYSFLREVDYCSGALLATIRKLFLEQGGFDVRFKPAYYEDVDYCFRLRAKGYRVYYQPESVVIHFEGASSGTDITAGIKRYQSANRQKFVEKWRETLVNQPAPLQQYDSATLHALALPERR